MARREVPEGFFLNLPPEFQGGSDFPGETHRAVSVRFYDLSDRQKARECRLDPGYYFTISPITPKEMEERTLLNKFVPFFLETLVKEKLFKHPKPPLPTDQEKNSDIDYSQSWTFPPVCYNSEKKTLVVRAEYFKPEDAPEMKNIKVMKK